MKKVLYFLAAAVFAVAMAACSKPAAGGDDTPGGDAPAPTADFEYTVDGLKVTFTNKSQNATASKWDFGDDETSKEASPVHTYAAPGTYTVKLTVANADGATASKEAQVTTAAGAPKAYFTFEAQKDRAGEFGRVINFDATASENASSISWDFGDGGEGSTEFKPKHLFPDYGKYTVKATVKNSDGADNTYQAEVDVVAYNELLQGGGMEEDDAKYWTVVTDFAFPEGNYDAPDENTPGWLHQFGFSEDKPKGGNGGCLRFVNNQVHDQANNFKFYQAIEVEEGDYLEISAQMKWGEKTNDCGLLWFGIAEAEGDVGKDGTSVVEMFNYWNPDWDNIGANSILPIDGGFEANADYIADNAAREIGYSNAGEPVAHYWAQKSGTVYFYVDYRSVWGTCFGPNVVILFDELSVKIVPAPEEE